MSEKPDNTKNLSALNIRNCFNKSGVFIKSLTWKAYSFLTLIYFMAWFSGQNLSIWPLFTLIFGNSNGNSKPIKQFDIKQILKQNGINDYPSSIPDLGKIHQNFLTFMDKIEQNWLYFLLAAIIFFTLAWYILHWQFRFLMTFLHSLNFGKVEWNFHKTVRKSSYYLSAIWLLGVIIFSIPTYYYSSKNILSIFRGDLNNAMFSTQGTNIIALSNLMLAFYLSFIFFIIVPFISITGRDFIESIIYIKNAFLNTPLDFLAFLIKKLLLTTIFGFLYFIASWTTYIMIGIALIIPVIILIFIFSKLLFFSTLLILWASSIIILSGILLLLYINFFIFLRFYMALSYIDLGFIERIFYYNSPHYEI